MGRRRGGRRRQRGRHAVAGAMSGTRTGSSLSRDPAFTAATVAAGGSVMAAVAGLNRGAIASADCAGVSPGFADGVGTRFAGDALASAMGSDWPVAAGGAETAPFEAASAKDGTPIDGAGATAMVCATSGINGSRVRTKTIRSIIATPVRIIAQARADNWIAGSCQPGSIGSTTMRMAGCGTDLT